MSVNPDALIEKLEKLNSTQQSIETLSQWCIFYKKDADKIVTLWEAEVDKSKDVEKMLALIYLANDILQNSRKKGPQFVNQFYTKLPPAMHKLVKLGGPEVRQKMAKMVKVWDDRRVFGSSGVAPFTDIMGLPGNSQAQRPAAVPSTAGRKRGNIVLQTSDPNVNSLSTSIQDAEDAYSRCQTLLPQTASVLRTESSQGGADGLKASIRSLKLQTTALENEIGHRERVIGILANLMSQQKVAKDAAEAQWSKHKEDLENRQQRLASAGLASSQNGNHAVPDSIPNSNSSPPPPQMGPPTSPPSHNDPRLAYTLNAIASQSGSAAPQGAEQIESRDPRNQSAEAAQVSQLLGSLTGGVSPGSGGQAADLVAQLSQSGMSAKMLIEALSSLPAKDSSQPNPFVENETSGVPDQAEEEEYDPELGE